jgi:hypothetical protein
LVVLDIFGFLIGGVTRFEGRHRLVERTRGCKGGAEQRAGMEKTGRMGEETHIEA